MKKSVMIIIAFALILASVAACSQAPSTPAPKASAPTQAPAPTAAVTPIVWTWDQGFSLPGTPMDDVSTKVLPERMKAATGGRLQINPLIGVTNMLETLAAVRDNRAQGGTNGDPFVGGSIPAITWPEVPFLLNNWDDWEKADAATRPYVNKILLEQWGVYDFRGAPFDEQQVFATRDLSTIDAWKGAKIRTNGIGAVQLTKDFGASPVSVNLSEVPTSIQRRMIDGYWSTVSTGWAHHIWESLKYANKWAVVWPGFSWVINKNAFDSLPEDLKPIVRQVMAEMGVEVIKTTRGAAADYQKQMEAPGKDMIFTVPSADTMAKAKQMGIAFWDVVDKTPGAGDTLRLARQALGR